MAHDDFEEHIRLMPEPKLQLIAGRFVVGNGGSGNTQLLRDLLEGWGAEAAIDMAPLDRWREALHRGFREFDPPAPGKPLATWKAWASQLSYTPEIPPAGPMVDGKHKATRESLLYGLFRLGRGGDLGQFSGGGDVVMRLGDDAVTPDVFAVPAANAVRLNDTTPMVPRTSLSKSYHRATRTGSSVKRGIASAGCRILDRRPAGDRVFAWSPHTNACSPCRMASTAPSLSMLLFREEVLWREYKDAWRRRQSVHERRGRIGDLSEQHP